MTDLRKMTTYLRVTSDRYDGIPHYLRAADGLDKAMSAFFKVQDVDALRDLQNAFSLVNKFYHESRAEDDIRSEPREV